MKKFTVMILCVSTFFVGLGGLVESVGARFKSDARALEIVRLARTALGGEENIKAVQGLTITGKATKTFEFDNAARVEKGDWELNLQLPNKLSKMVKIATEENVGTGNPNKQVDVVIVRKGENTENELISTDASKKVLIVKKDENGNVLTENVVNTNGEVRRAEIDENLRVNMENHRRSEIFRTVIFLLLTPPQGTDAEYIFAGESSVDGTNCEVVQVNANGMSVKLFISKSSHLPVMMSYTDAKPFMIRLSPGETTTDGDRVNFTVNQKTEAQTGEFQVKFSDYRTVNGVQFPHKWTQTVDGKADESIEVTAYEINPANIAEKFKDGPQNIRIRTEKPKQ